MSRIQLSLLLALSMCCLSITAAAEDIVELTTGARPKGKVISQSGNYVVLEIKIGSKTFTRRYPKSKVKNVILGGSPSGSGTTTKSSSGSSRSKQEILDEINSVGRTPPDWYDSAQLNYPRSLDLSWPEPAPKPWNSSKNIGQYIWDRINPNPGNWQSGVKLMHHIMTVNKDDRRVIDQAMRSLGTMYHNLHEDYARSAFWLHQAGVDKNPSDKPNLGVKLADCYYKLGNKDMAIELMRKMDRRPYSVIKLLGDMGETDGATSTADAYAKNATNVGAETICYLYAGDALRQANRLDAAQRYYEKALAAAKRDPKKGAHQKRNLDRATANIAAIRFLKLKVSDVRDGTYTASSIGYEGQVHVEVVVSGGRIDSVKVTQHKEKQFYSSISDTTRNIVDRQNLIDIDTTTGATITSEAIINATAKALSQGT